MNANPDQLAGSRSPAGLPAKSAKNISQVSFVSPPATRLTWFSSYEEEWAAFLTVSSMKKTRPALSNGYSEALPRVWNIPCT